MNWKYLKGVGWVLKVRCIRKEWIERIEGKYDADAVRNVSERNELKVLESRYPFEVGVCVGIRKEWIESYVYLILNCNK